MNPLSVFFMVQVRCSIPIWVVVFFMGACPGPDSLSGICTPSVGKIGNSPMACLLALLSMPSMVVSCRLLKSPRSAA